MNDKDSDSDKINRFRLIAINEGFLIDSFSREIMIRNLRLVRDQCWNGAFCLQSCKRIEREREEMYCMTNSHLNKFEIIEKNSCKEMRIIRTLGFTRLLCKRERHWSGKNKIQWMGWYTVTEKRFKHSDEKPLYHRCYHPHSYEQKCEIFHEFCFCWLFFCVNFAFVNISHFTKRDKITTYFHQKPSFIHLFILIQCVIFYFFDQTRRPKRNK